MALLAFILLNTSQGEMITMQYDDGTAATIASGYTSVWFHADDFLEPEADFQLESTELWFLHSSSYPWDTPQFTLEIWGSTDSGVPETLLFETLATAQNYLPVEIDLMQQNITPDEDFIIAANKEFSAGGWPSLALDATPPVVPHSSSWDGWITTGDLLVRCDVEILTESLSPHSWAGLKTVFSR